MLTHLCNEVSILCMHHHHSSQFFQVGEGLIQLQAETGMEPMSCYSLFISRARLNSCERDLQCLSNHTVKKWWAIYLGV